MPTSLPEGQPLAVWAEALYLANLLVAPGLAFLVLLWLYWRHHREAPPLARNHLRLALWASLLAGALLILVNGLIILLGGYQAADTWLIVILYFTICHSALVILGIYGLARAMAGKPFRHPLPEV